MGFMIVNSETLTGFVKVAKLIREVCMEIENIVPEEEADHKDLDWFATEVSDKLTAINGDFDIFDQCVEMLTPPSKNAKPTTFKKMQMKDIVKPTEAVAEESSAKVLAEFLANQGKPTNLLLSILAVSIGQAVIDAVNYERLNLIELFGQTVLSDYESINDIIKVIQNRYCNRKVTSVNLSDNNLR